MLRPPAKAEGIFVQEITVKSIWDSYFRHDRDGKATTGNPCDGDAAGDGTAGFSGC